MLTLLTALTLGQLQPIDAPRVRPTPLTFHRDGPGGFIDFSDKKAASEKALRTAGMISMIGGGALIAGGGAFWTLARLDELRLRGGDPRITSGSQLDATIRRAKLFEGLGWGLASTGLAALAIGFGLQSAAGPQAGAVSLEATPGGAFAAISGRIP